MDYWAETMRYDTPLIAENGRKATPHRVLETNTNKTAHGFAKCTQTAVHLYISTFGYMTMKQLKQETLSIRTSGNIKQLLKLAAEQEHRSVASMVEALVLTYAKEHGLDAIQGALVKEETRKKTDGDD